LNGGADLFCKRAVYALSLFTGLVLSASAQDINNHKLLRCDQPAQLTFKERACYFGNQFSAPSGLARALFFSGFEQLRNTPSVERQDNAGEEFAHRFAAFYERRAAKNMGEFLAGSLNHEDPRYRPSNLHGTWARTRYALRSVVETTNENGTRVSLGPIAGSLGSGFVGMAVYRYHNGVDDAFRRTGTSYGCYFLTAVLREFAPDLTVKANRLLHRRSQD
jgi:hypothetical protein